MGRPMSCGNPRPCTQGPSSGIPPFKVVVNAHMKIRRASRKFGKRDRSLTSSWSSDVEPIIYAGFHVTKGNTLLLLMVPQHSLISPLHNRGFFSTVRQIRCRLEFVKVVNSRRTDRPGRCLAPSLVNRYVRQVLKPLYSASRSRQTHKQP
jgi:hypothetical protein